VLKKICPICGIIEPMFPPRFELVFYRRRELPKCDHTVRVEYLAAAMRRHSEDCPSLREIMRARKASPYRCSAEAAELSPRIPPPRFVHLPEPCHDKAQFEELFEVYRCGNHWVRLSSAVPILNPKHSAPTLAFRQAVCAAQVEGEPIRTLS